MADVIFQQVCSAEHKQQAGDLIREYLEWLNQIAQRDYGIAFDVRAMVASDLADHDKFHPPDGRFYLVMYDGTAAGVGCLKKLEAGVGEIQRMYVLSRLRGKGLGRAIVNRLIEDARSIGYRRLKLESLEFLEAAHSLYRSVGFREIDPYADNSMKSYQDAENLHTYYAITVFMELDLEKPESGRLIRIISGGQTGADRAALDIALKLNIAHGGWIPRGRLAEDGPLDAKYKLKEMPTDSYSARTEKNVLDSDGTVILTHGKPSGGTDYTREMALRHGKQMLCIDLNLTSPSDAASSITSWIQSQKIKDLNVAGPRASEDPGIYGDVFRIIEAVVRNLA